MEETTLDSDYLDGSVDDVCQQSSKIVRVFLSSTFSDMAEERNILLRQAYPRVKDYAMKKYGVMFQVVDMRWGVTNEVQNDHMTSAVCLKEIRNCQQLSIGPNFVALLGQKYGYRPIPAIIDADEFEAIRGGLSEEGKDMSLLDVWYLRDDNSVPPQYTLQPITSRLPGYDCSNDDLKREARDEWQANFEAMRDLLKSGADLAFDAGRIGGQTKEKYYMSVTEDEIQLGLLQNQTEADTKCLCFLREIDDLNDNINHHRAAKFLDIVSAGNAAEIDKEASFFLNSLREKIGSTLRKENIVRLSTKWSDDGGVNAIDSSEYLERLCEVFCEKMIWLIDENLKESGSIRGQPHNSEIIQSLQIRDDWTRVFFGREDILLKVERYLNDVNNRCPLALYGESGCGKTSLIAKCSKMTPVWKKNQQCVTITRFLGTSTYSSQIVLTIQSICRQICTVYSHELGKPPTEFKDLVELFHSLLQLPSSSRSLVIYLDSLDQLAPSMDPYNLRWLPHTLPRDVKIIVSFIPTSKLHKRFQAFVADSPSNLVPIQPLGDDVSMKIVHERLRLAERTITQEQEQVISDLFTKCSLPLFSRIIVDEVSTWKSHTEINSEMVSASVRDALHNFFERLEQHHGRVLVRHALAYITASRDGLSEIELLDLLSLDDDVLSSIFLFWLPPSRRIPPFLWTRLKVDLDKFLVTRASGDTEVMVWYHRQFSEVAKERYLCDDDTNSTIHGNMAEYFIGVWGDGRKKPFTYSPFLKARLALTNDIGEADRNVPSQPLKFTQSKSGIVYNKRKLNELPYHLVACKNVDTLSELCVFNYLWLWTRLSVFGLQSLIDDLNMALEARTDNEVQLLTDALRIAGGTLNAHPNNLSIELTGRLMDFFNTMPNIRDLISQSDVEAAAHSAVISPFQLFELPISALSKSLEGTKADISDIVFVNSGSELITFSEDGVLQKWDVKKGELVNELELSVKSSTWQSNRLRKSADEKFILCLNRSSRYNIFIVKSKSLSVITCHTVNHSNLYTNVVASCNYFCMDNAVFELTTGKKIHSINDYRKVKSFVTVAFTRDEENILIGGDAMVEVYTILKAKKLKEIPVENSVTDIKVTKDGRLAIIGTTIQCKIHIYDINVQSETFGQRVVTYDPIKCFPNVDFQGFNYATEEVSELQISNKQGAFVSLVKYRYPIIWSLKNISTKPRLLTLPNTGATLQLLRDVQFSADDRYILAREVSPKVYVWDAITGEILAVFSAHPSETHRLLASPLLNIAVTTPLKGTSVKIWDISQLLKMGEYSTKKDQDMSVESITFSKDSKYAFISKVQHQKSMKAYHFIDYFGIDILDLSTGLTTNIFPFDRYGSLQSCTLSTDASTLVLTLGTVASSVITVVDMNTQTLLTLTVSNCKHVNVSGNGAYLAVFTSGSPSIAKLYSLPSMIQLCSYSDCVSGMFTARCTFVGITTKNELIVRETIEVDEELRISMQGDFKSMHYCDATEVLLLTVDGGRQICSTAYKTECFGVIGTIVGISSGGMCDVANDGSICIDSDLQIFELQRCKRIKKLLSGRTKGDLSSVKLSRSGEHSVFIDTYPTECVKVCRISDSDVISQVCLHSAPVFITLIPDSDIIMAVGKDRQLSILALKDGDRGDLSNCCTLSERLGVLMGNRALEKLDNLQQPHVSEKIRESIKETSKTHQAKNFSIQLENKSSGKLLLVTDSNTITGALNHETFADEQTPNVVRLSPVKETTRSKVPSTKNTDSNSANVMSNNTATKSSPIEEKSTTCTIV